VYNYEQFSQAAGGRSIVPKSVVEQPKRTAQSAPKGGVPSVAKATRVLQVLADSKEPLSLAQLTRALSQPKSSVLAICTTLVHAGLLRKLPDGRYRLGTRVLDLARAYLGSINVAEEFTEAHRLFPTPNGEGMVLAVLDETDVVYIACRNSDLPLDINYRIGMRLPAHCAATGKALLSTLPESRVRALYKRSRLTPLTPYSLRSLDALLEDLGKARALGYATDDEETREGMICYGAPVLEWSDEGAVAAVAVTALKQSLDKARREKLVSTVTALAGYLSDRLGGKHQAGVP